MTDWKQELRDVLAEAVHVEMQPADDIDSVWEITISDERMKELEEMLLWTMERMND